MNERSSSRLRDLAPFLRLYFEKPFSIVYGLAMAFATLVGALGLLGLSCGFLFACAAAGLNPAVAETFDIVLAPGAIRLFALVRSAGRYAERVATHDTTFELIARLRTSLYEKLAALSARQVSSIHSGDVLGRMVKDVDALENLYQRLVIPFGAAALVFVAVAATAAIANPAFVVVYAALAIVSLAIVPAIAFGLGRSTSARLTALNARLRTTAIDTIETLEEASLEPGYFEERRSLCFDVEERRTASWLELQFRLAVLKASLIAASGLAGFAVVALASFLGPTIDGPWLVAAAILAFGLLEAILPLPSVFLEAAGTAASAGRILSVVSQEPNPRFVPDEPETSPSPRSDSPAIEVRDVRFSYDLEDVLRSVRFVVAAAERVAVVGPSGCGKSTLAKLVTRMEDPSEGEIRIAGNPIALYGEAKLREIVVATEQTPWIFEGTIESNLRLANPPATEDALWAALETVGLAQTVRSWPDGLSTRVEQGGESLSGGQRKRLAIARALVKDAWIYVFDEPTEGLEAGAATELVDRVLSSLAGKTIVWVTHRREAIDRFDRVVTWNPGVDLEP